MVSVIDPTAVKISIADAGEDASDPLATGYTELLGIGSFEIDPGKKDVEMIVGFASSDSNRFHLVKKPAGLVTVTLSDALLDMATVKNLFYDSSNTPASRTTENVALAIVLTQQDSTVVDHNFDNAYLVDFKISGSKDNAVMADLTFVCKPTDYTVS